MPFPPEAFTGWQAQLSRALCRADTQVDTPEGGFALAEWLRDGKTLLKNAMWTAPGGGSMAQGGVMKILFTFRGRAHSMKVCCKTCRGTELEQAVLCWGGSRYPGQRMLVNPHPCGSAFAVDCRRGVGARAGTSRRVAGYRQRLSISAYPAAVIAGALDFTDALKLVALRGDLMEQAYPHGYGLTAIMGLTCPRWKTCFRGQEPICC